VDVARDVVVKLAREDARWFSWLAVFFALVIFLILPLIGYVGIKVKLMLDDNDAVLAYIRREKKDLDRLKRELIQIKNPAEDAEKGQK
jgi:hypothetical protein